MKSAPERGGLDCIHSHIIRLAAIIIDESGRLTCTIHVCVSTKRSSSAGGVAMACSMAGKLLPQDSEPLLREFCRPNWTACIQHTIPGRG